MEVPDGFAVEVQARSCPFYYRTSCTRLLREKVEARGLEHGA